MLTKAGCQKGVGLIEVLTSMLILSVGVLGMISVQSRSVQFNQGAMYESKASILAGDLIDRIRANASQASNYRIGLNESAPSASVCEGALADCDGRAMAAYDLASWREEIEASLPEGTSEVTEVPAAGGVSVFIVTIQYQDSRAENATAFGQAGNSEPKQLIFRTSL